MSIKLSTATLSQKISLDAQAMPSLREATPTAVCSLDHALRSTFSDHRRLTLVDFGAAKYAATGTALIKTGTTIGSAGYTAPEQLMGKAVFQSDLYSLGVTCIHLLTQVPPFDLVDSAEGNWVWRDYLSDPISEQLGSILNKLLEGGTRKRYTTAKAVMSDLIAKPSVQPMVISDVAAVEKEQKPLRSKIVAVGVASIVGVSAVARIGLGTVYLFNWVDQPLVVHAPQTRTQPRLVPVPKTSPSPQNLQPKAEVLDNDKLISLISIIGRISSILLLFGGIAKTRSCLYRGADLSLLIEQNVIRSNARINVQHNFSIIAVNFC